MEGKQPGLAGGVKGFWGELKTPMRAAVIGGAVLVVALIIYAAVWAQTPDYATLFSGLGEQDAAAIVDQLKALEVPYRLAQGGSVIQVPERTVYETRLQLAKQGLPKGDNVGFELFDGGQLGNLGMTDFMQRVNFQRALEGELARTIASLDPVAQARVHIVIPEASLFLAETKEPTASVVVQLKPNSQLTREQVNSINHLIASSVEGMKPSNITIVDMQGALLAAAGSSTETQTSLQTGSSQLEMQRSFEREMTNRLQTMLDQAWGPNRAVVRVSATLNWDQKQTNNKTFLLMEEPFLQLYLSAYQKLTFEHQIQQSKPFFHSFPEAIVQRA